MGDIFGLVALSRRVNAHPLPRGGYIVAPPSVGRIPHRETHHATAAACPAPAGSQAASALVRSFRSVARLVLLPAQ